MMRYEKYDAWRVSHTLALEVYQTTEQWPKSELYGLMAQTRRRDLATTATDFEPQNGNGWTRCEIAPASWYGGFTGGPSSGPEPPLDPIHRAVFPVQRVPAFPRTRVPPFPPSALEVGQRGGSFEDSARVIGGRFASLSLGQHEGRGIRLS
jgi:hypothetical protein